MKLTQEEFIAYVRAVIDMEKHIMEEEGHRFNRSISDFIGEKSNKFPKHQTPAPPPKMELRGSLKLIDEALNKLV